MKKISIAEKFALFDEQWTPKIIAESNGQLIKLAKGSGELVWHVHENEDELFLVFKGQLTLKLPQTEVVLGPGDMFVVPKGMRHCPVAEPDTQILLIEPASTLHTGQLETEATVAREDQLWI